MSNIYNLEPPTKGKVGSGRHASVDLASSHSLAPPCVRAVAHTASAVRACWVQVLLKTNLGDLEIELWPKEAPKVRCDAHLAIDLPVTPYIDALAAYMSI